MNFGSKNSKFWFEKPEVSVRKPKVSVRKPEASVQNPEVSGKIFELETSVKVVFRNVSSGPEILNYTVYVFDLNRHNCYL
jgi:hypothetical protein